MFIVESYYLAVVLCFFTMICWGSWANTQKLSPKSWSFTLFYWDYSIGVLLFSLFIGLTFGSFGEDGRPLIDDLFQANKASFVSAFLGGVIFNLANLLIVAAISIAGMSVAFPVGIGIALILGVLVNYIATPVGNPILLFFGVFLIGLAIILDALAYKFQAGKNKKSSTKGIMISVIGGILMGLFYRFVASSMSSNFTIPKDGLFTPYSALLIFSFGIFISNFLWNTYFMYKPLDGIKVKFEDYFKNSNFKIHLIGVFGGVIWCAGMTLSLLSSEMAGYPISYGLGQGATMIAAAWGVFVWNEFENASKKINILISLMFLFFIVGLILIIISRFN
jgi:glucose uptake protein